MGTKRTKSNRALNRQPKAAKSEKQLQEVQEPGETKALINTDTYKRLYAGMLKCRMVEERACALLGRQKAASAYKRALGQEAMAVGTVVVLGSEDEIAPSDRSLIAQTVAGAPLKTVFEQLFSAAGKVSSAPARGADVSLLCVTPAARPETQVVVATGFALAHRNDSKSYVVLAISGEEWPESDGLRAALEFAVGNRLPIVYVISNDEITDESRSEHEKVITMARTCGVTVITVDGTDAVAVYRVASESISRARKGVGPTLIDCRFLPAPMPARSRKSASRQSHLDPLLHLESYMRKRNVWSDSWKQGLVEQLKREIESAVKVAERVSAKKARARRAKG